MNFIVTTSHGSFYVEADNAGAAKTFALGRLQARHPGEDVTVWAVRTCAV